MQGGASLVCERCGSINIRRVRANAFERFLRLFNGKKRFFCKRCGWSAMRDWDETAPRMFPKQPEKPDLKLVIDASAQAQIADAELDPRR